MIYQSDAVRVDMILNGKSGKLFRWGVLLPSAKLVPRLAKVKADTHLHRSVAKIFHVCGNVRVKDGSCCTALLKALARDRGAMAITGPGEFDCLATGTRTGSTKLQSPIAGETGLHRDGRDW
jgi:hypothetical protein